MNEHPRRPAAFRLDDPHVVVTADETAAPRGSVRVVMEAEPALPVPVAPELPARRRLPWGTMFWTSLGGLTLLGLGASVTRLIEDMFDRSLALGSLALALAAVAGVACSAIVLREALGLWRLGAIDKLRQRGIDTLASDDRIAGGAVAREVLALAKPMPRLARRRVRLEEHLSDIIDGADLVRLAERELLEPLDAEARGLVGDAAKRVSLVTAVSPRAAIDMLFVLVTAVTLVRKLAYLYGGRPGTLGLVRLMRTVIAHLALTGGMAASDSVIQQVLGHGLAAKLSVRLGEGVLNGLLTARVGLAAIEVTRPLPFAALPPPTLSDVAGNLLQRRTEGKAEVATAADA